MIEYILKQLYLGVKIFKYFWISEYLAFTGQMDRRHGIAQF